MADIVITELYGHCPVQAEGAINGKPFYFRARYERWRIEIGGALLDKPEWSYSEPYGDGPYAAGWMEEAEAREFIKQAAERYAAESVSTIDG